MERLTLAGELQFWYRNHRSETAIHRVRVTGIRWGVSFYHPEPQWLLVAHDLDKDAEREFAMARMKPTTMAQAEAEHEARKINSAETRWL